MIEFVSYTGRFPNLCSGIFTVKINGKEVSFGHDNRNYDRNTYTYNDSNYDEFWVSGGECGEDLEYDCTEAPWRLSVSSHYPEEIANLLPELLECFNENVPYGCCGGCI